MKTLIRKWLFKIGVMTYLSRWRVYRRRGWRGLWQALGRRICRGGLWQRYSEEAALLVAWLDFSHRDIEASQKVHANNPGQLEIHSITWFLPDFHHAYYGGIFTILRFADFFHRRYNVENRFVIVGTMSAETALRKIGEAFPALAISEVERVSHFDDLSRLRATDAAIATLWSTAYFLLHFNATKRKFYFMQDYEPLFYPAGSTYGQVDATFRFGFYGIANTPAIAELYRQHSGGQPAEYFLPCVDVDIFHPAEKPPARGTDGNPYRLFFYGRPGHPRNSFELGSASLRILKQRLGNAVEIFSAGAEWRPAEFDLGGVLDNLGVLSIEETAELYRSCDVGLVMMFTRHPSYLPFELMASGTLVVTNYNPATLWMLKDGENCLLSEASPTCLADTLERGLREHDLREQITARALEDIISGHRNWDAQIEKIYRFMVSPRVS